MQRRQLLAPRIGAALRWILAVLACVGVLLGVGYATRHTLFLNVARIVLNRDSELVAQERADAVGITFARPAPLWITPMKNQMNSIWDPIRANGVNYYMFAKPQTWFRTYSERSNPISPYYQAWAGGYVIKARDGSLPTDLEALAWQVTALDQRSWLSAMGDPHPVADSSPATRLGDITIDGQRLPLWHGTMRSHSDLSAHPTGPLATLIGMPSKYSWPKGIDSFHDVTLDGYFACWTDSQHKISIVIYAVAADYATQTEKHSNSDLINDDLLRIMKSAKLEAVH
jgi:hypothetical protein